MNYKRESFQGEGSIQARTTSANSPRRLVASNAPDQQRLGNPHGDASGGRLQSPENSPQKADETAQKQNTQRALETGSQPMIYEFDASPEQLAIIIRQINEKSESFSAPKFAENYRFGANYYSGGLGGGAGGGRPAGLPREQQQAKADAGGTNPSQEEAAQPQAAADSAPGSANQGASPAARRAEHDHGQMAPEDNRARGTANQIASRTGATKQHVVFVLNVVEHLAPAASRASQTPAPTAAPAKP